MREHVTNLAVVLDLGGLNKQIIMQPDFHKERHEVGCDGRNVL